MDQMNIVIVGHVDHGKSTIVGRLLADTDSLPENKLDQIRELCRRTSKPFEYAFLLDALKDEQAQGITIDAARVFFKTNKRRYIIIDAPGHIEFLKNMITGASRADAAVLVIDAEEGVRENSRRHGYMLSMLGIRQLVVLVNKMDLVGYDEGTYNRIVEEYSAFLKNVNLVPTGFIPVSGREGDFIAGTSPNILWYDGPTLLDTLDSFKTPETEEEKPFRMPVQDVYKFTRFGDARRVIAGTIATGNIAVGDQVVFYPSGKTSTVKSIEVFPEPASRAARPQSESAPNPVGFTLTEQIYVTRGETACLKHEEPPKVSTRLKASLFWLGRVPMTLGKEYLLRVGNRKVRAHLESIEKLIDASTLDQTETGAPTSVGRHEVAECTLCALSPLAFDLHGEISATGRFVIIDDYEITGGGIITEALTDDGAWVREKVITRNLRWEKGLVTEAERAERYGQRPALVLVTGHANSRKKEFAKGLEKRLFTEGRLVYYVGLGSILYGVDADIKRVGVSSLDIHREEHLRRFAEVAHLMLDAGMLVIASAMDITAEDTDLIRTVLQNHPLSTIWTGEGDGGDLSVDLHLTSSESIEAGVERMVELMMRSGRVFNPEG